MKKIIIIFLVLMMFACSKKVHYKARVIYDVCWPDTTICYDTIVECSYATYAWEDTIMHAKIESHRGTNYINIYPGFNYLMETTAPIRLYSAEKIN